jgi:hypothetical protein
MSGFRRRSWASTRPPRNDGMRLSTMIVLFVIVVALMVIASRPQIWSRFVPSWDEPAKTAAAKSSQRPDSSLEVEPATPFNRTRMPAPARRASDKQSPLLMGGLIVAAVLYFAWRIARIGRAMSRRVEAKRNERDKPRAQRLDKSP